MKELNSFTVEEIEEIIRSCQQEIHNTPTSDEFPVSPRLLLSLARIALAAKRAEPVYQYQSGVCTFDDIEWVWDDCDKGFYEQYDPTRRRIVYTTPQLNSPDGWIKCSDQMPENDERKPVAVYTGNCLGQGMFVASYDDNEFSDYWEGTEIKGVTHWMPLPAAPEKP
ncbi:DUF551 domain-containing protein [Yersinia pseudotuberculosis]|uniref:DUF551 domain-containing protein n=1 Tax=Yersinia pseudotuberculosis TaxID=633 RepID=UPI0005E2292D|nr:DUF551 domain-containing protein [Yersinia pseudotuberculosis]CNC75432.1 Protein of uncharacterised function (DUF551) [Yersinia pseudotuberculosis]